MRMSLRKAAIIGLAALALSGCSALRLGYSTGTQLAWWWFDGYLDFSSAQAPAVKASIQRWFDWHRATQLPEYATVLVMAQQAVMEPLTKESACRWQDQIIDKLGPAIDRGAVQAAELVPGLGETQFKALEKRYARNIADMKSDFLQPDPAERQQKSIERAIDRAEMLYGKLGDAQRKVIADGVIASPFDPEAWAVERARRQRDTLLTLRRLVAEKADVDARVAALRALVQRTEKSPNADYRAYQIKLIDYNCGFSAQLHNATTTAQRLVARDKLKGWEEDLRSLYKDTKDGPARSGSVDVPSVRHASPRAMRG